MRGISSALEALDERLAGRSHIPFHTGKPQNDALPDSAAVRDMNAFRRSHFRFAQVDFQSPLKQLPRLTVSLSRTHRIECMIAESEESWVV